MESAIRASARLYHTARQNKALRVALMAAAVGALVLYVSEIQARDASHGSHASTSGAGAGAGAGAVSGEEARELMQQLRALGRSGGAGDSGAMVQLQAQIEALNRRIEVMGQGEGAPGGLAQGEGPGSFAEKLVGCQKELKGCREGQTEADANAVVRGLRREKEALERRLQEKCAGGGGGGASKAAEESERLVEAMKTEKELLLTQLRIALEGSGADDTPVDVKQLRLENRVLRLHVAKLEVQMKRGWGPLAQAQPDGAHGGHGAVAQSPSSSSGAEVEVQELRRRVVELEAQAALGQGAGAQGSDSLEALKRRLEDSEVLTERVMAEKRQLTQALAQCNSASGTMGGVPADSAKVQEAVKKAIAECGSQQGSPSLGNGSKLYSCEATDEELQRYLAYKPREECPDDWYFIQYLVYVKGCFCLPRRRCFAPMPPDYREPTIPFPDSLFDADVLSDRNVRWTKQYWAGYQALNTRKLGDCRDCFNLTLEANRWRNNYRGTIALEDMLTLKGKGALKVGLDAGGGTGSFAAKMAQHGVTIVTTAMNTETLPDKEGGLPYMETIAQRGLIPLYVPHKARQPFFDGTLDIIHAINSIKYFTIPEFEELLFEWDRILRPGGVLWFELFYAPVDEMPLYIAVLDIFNYKKLYWNMAPKTDAPEREGAHVYLNCVLEKPRRPDPSASASTG